MSKATSVEQERIAAILADKASRQIYGFMRYLKSQPNAQRVCEDSVIYDVEGSTVKGWNVEG